MPITYTSRKNKTYTLCKGETKTGKPRYFFAREPKGEIVDEIPDGYEIAESVNGIVSLSKARPKLISDDELAVIQSAIDAHPEGRKYRVNRKHNCLEIYEGIGVDSEGLIKIFQREFGGISPSIADKMRQVGDRHQQYTAVMRFTLQDKKDRLFESERMCYLGSIDDWITIGMGQTLQQIAEIYIPVLGTEDFFKPYTSFMI